ncbi:TPA: cobalt ABC transporter ATP-binding protein [Candidatus Sumerlaeota bacterium]|nr:cobalt ABC transporter ATP-binding protein [Candidatus Sumerlaeota bacterium]
MSHHLVEMQDVHYTYPDGAKALRGVSFRLTHGETVGIIGGNGAGKSTLLLHLNGCLMPTSGAVRVDNFPVSTATLTHVRKTVGMVFQNPDDQLFMPTVEEDVAFGPRNMGLPSDEVNARVDAALETVGALAFKHRASHRLSGGEKRTVAIATVLSMSPDILVLDEPTAGLDPRARRHLIELLKTLEHTLIIATHDLDFVLDVCDRTLVIHEGCIAADDATEAIFKNVELLDQNNLEPPLSMQRKNSPTIF